MIYFNIPSLYYKRDLFLFIKYMEQIKPYIFRENIAIGSVYDIIPYCIWDGGRIFGKVQQASKNEILETKKLFNEKYNIPIRLIYTNAYLQPNDLKNTWCNLVTTLLEDEMNEIVVASPLLEAYLRQNYPAYKIISSTTKRLTDFEDFKKEINNPNYYQVCIDYDLNHDFEHLKSLTQEEKDKCEFLCNAICFPNCPSRKEHYKFNAQATLNWQNIYGIRCYMQNNLNTFNKYKNHISIDEIINTYEPMGFSHFKLEGRTLGDQEVLTNYAHYFIKPEYQLEFISHYHENK